MLSLTLIALVLAGLAARFAWQRHVERSARTREPGGMGNARPCAAPIALHDPPSASAVLLLHGFGDTTRTLEPLASALRARGHCVYAPLLPGHGGTLSEFRDSGWEQWLEGARRALDELTRRYEHVSVAGLSMGGALAAALAAEHAELTALVLLAPYLGPPRTVRLLARGAWIAGALAPYLRAEDPRSIHDPVERERVRGLGIVTPRLVNELVRLADRARDALPKVRAPTLYIQSLEDNRISTMAAEQAFALLGAREKRLEWLSGCGHVITVDYCRERVAGMVGDWVEMWLAEGERSSDGLGVRGSASGNCLAERDLTSEAVPDERKPSPE